MLSRLLRRRAVNQRWHRSQLLIALNKKDHLTLGDAFENIVIFGGVGSGKTSGSSFAITRRLLELGLGGLVLTAKPGEAERWRKLCELTGRSEDLIIVDDSGKYQFSFLDYALKLVGRSGSGIENLVATLDAVMKVAERATGSRPGKGQEAFWEQGIRRHARSIIALPVFATGEISISFMLEMMREVPRSLEQANSEEWRAGSMICNLLAIARAKATDALTLHDLNQIEGYFLREFPALAERTRSIFEAGLFGIIDLLSRGSLYATFGQSSNFTPSDCEHGRIIVVSWPTSTHGAVGMIAQTIVKLAFQRMAQQRSGNDNQPVFQVIDEFQSLMTETDYQHCAVSRESRVVNVLITQSISSLYAVLGADDSGKAAVDSLLGLANIKIFHANADHISNTWAAEVIGRRMLRTRSCSLNHAPYRAFEIFPEQPGFTTTSAETVEYAVMPHVFTSLLRGGPPKLQTEAILFGSGRVWKTTNETYLKVVFNQGF